MIVTLAPEVEQQLATVAAQKGVDPSSFVASLVEKALGAELALAPVNGVGHDDDYDPQALNRAVAAALNRTPEQKSAAREKAIKASQPRFALPPGVSAEEIWDSLKSGEQSDEDDLESLSRAIARTIDRTPEQIEATRAEVMRGMPEPLPFPAEKNVDVRDKKNIR